MVRNLNCNKQSFVKSEKELLLDFWYGPSVLNSLAQLDAFFILTLPRGHRWQQPVGIRTSRARLPCLAECHGAHWSSCALSLAKWLCRLLCGVMRVSNVSEYLLSSSRTKQYSFQQLIANAFTILCTLKASSDRTYVCIYIYKHLQIAIKKKKVSNSLWCHSRQFSHSNCIPGMLHWIIILHSVDGIHGKKSTN